MGEIQIKCNKEIEMKQQRMEAAVQSLTKSMHLTTLQTNQTLTNQEKIERMRLELRRAEEDLVKALSVKTRKVAKKMAIADSISATKARTEELKKIVADQRRRKDEYAEIISYQSEVLKECEEKHKQDAECREEVEEAILWYNRVLGFRVETGRGIKFIFTNINPNDPNKEYFFTIRLEKDIYSLLDCHPQVSEAKKMIEELNITNGLYSFVRTMRAKFQEVAAGEKLLEIASHPQETTIITMSAPLSSVSTENGSGSPATVDRSRQGKRGRKPKSIQGVQSSILSPVSASSTRKSPRFKAKK